MTQLRAISPAFQQVKRAREKGINALTESIKQAKIDDIKLMENDEENKDDNNHNHNHNNTIQVEMTKEQWQHIQNMNQQQKNLNELNNLQINMDQHFTTVHDEDNSLYDSMGLFRTNTSGSASSSSSYASSAPPAPTTPRGKAPIARSTTPRRKTNYPKRNTPPRTTAKITTSRVDILSSIWIPDNARCFNEDEYCKLIQKDLLPARDTDSNDDLGDIDMESWNAQDMKRIHDQIKKKKKEKSIYNQESNMQNFNEHKKSQEETEIYELMYQEMMDKAIIYLTIDDWHELQIFDEICIEVKY